MTDLSKLRTGIRKVSLLLVPLFFGLSFSLFSQTPAFVWAKGLNTGASELSHDVVVDPVTNSVYMVGQWKNSLTAFFPTGATPSQNFTVPYGQADGFVAKYDSNGNFLWAFKLGGPGDDFINEIVLDPAGNFYITGYFGSGASDAYFSGTSAVTGSSTLNNISKDDCFVAKYNSNGQFQWVRRSASGTGDIRGQDLHATANEVYVTGTYNGLCSFGALPITQLFGGLDIFLIKYDSNGNEQWLIVGGSTGNDEANGVTADDNSVFVTGGFKGTSLILKTTAGANAITLAAADASKEEIHLFSYSSTGMFRWGKTISSVEEGFAYDITSDLNNLYLTGGHEGPTYFPSYSGNPVSSTANRDIFISSHTKTDGSTNWINSVPCSDGGSEYGYSIAINGSSDLFISGSFKSTLTFPGPLAISSGGQEDVVVAGYSNTGTFKWAVKAGSGGVDYGYGVSAGSDGSIYFSGAYDNLFTAGALPSLPSDGSENVFLVKLQLPCTDAVGGTATTGTGTICVGGAASITLTGYSGAIKWQSSPPGAGTWTDIAGATLPVLSVSPVTTTDYRAFLSSGTCLTATSNIVRITVNQPPTTSNAGPDQTGASTCGLTSVTLAANSPAVGNGSWSIVSGTGGTVVSPGSANSTFTGVAGNTYQLRWTISNAPCAPSTSDVTITFNQLPTVANAGSDQTGAATCGVTTVTLAGNTPTVGTGLWSIISGTGGTITTPTSPTSTFSGVAGSTYVLRWTISNPPCAPSTSDVTITLNQLPSVANAGPDQTGATTCGVTTVTLAGNTPTVGTGLWSIISGTGGTITTPTSPTSTFSGVAGSTYVLQWRISNGVCAPSSGNTTITFQKQPVANAGTGGDECDLDFNLIAIPSAGIGTWSMTSGNGTAIFAPDANSPNAIVSVSEFGTKVFTWTEANNACTSSSVVTVNFYQQPVADAGPDQTLDFLFSTFLSGNSVANSSGFWESNDPGPVITDITNPFSEVTNLSLGLNLFTWHLKVGTCPESTDEVIIEVKDILPPTIITPNDDGLNDELIFSGISALSGCEITIYNRWGHEVYRDNNYQNNWKGKDMKDRDLQADTYYYILKLPTGRVIKGFIEIRK